MAILNVFVLLAISYIPSVRCGDWPDQRLTVNLQKVLCNLGCICSEESATPFLDCTRKSIEKLPKMIAFSYETKVVTFHENNLQNISEDTFFEASKILELDLSSNKLNLIEDYALRPFRFLSLLRLTNNNFTHFTPKLLFGLTKLRVLEAGHNSLQQLPDDLFALTGELQELKLQFNNLLSLPKKIFKSLINLEKLDLGGNSLITLPAELFQTTSRLHWLSLTQNRFSEVPKEALAKVEKLHLLDLSQNPIDILSSKSFPVLRNVTALYLNELSRLSRIEKNTFASMTGLKMLSCNYNKKLYFFHPEAFGDSYADLHPRIIFPSEQLLLRENGLKSLSEPQRIELWSKLNYVDFRDNPWRCDCSIRWMKKLKSNAIENVRCESPFSLHGRTIGSLTEEELVCSDHWMFSTVILMVTSLLTFFVCFGMVTMIVCYKTALGRSIRSKHQFSYRKFVPKKDVDNVDLEWDPTNM